MILHSIIGGGGRNERGQVEWLRESGRSGRSLLEVSWSGRWDGGGVLVRCGGERGDYWGQVTRVAVALSLLPCLRAFLRPFYT